MKNTTWNKRFMAWFLTFVMVMSLVMVPAGKVQAADDISLTISDGSGTVTGDANNNVDINITAPSGYGTVQSLVDAGYTKLQVSYSVTSYTAAASGTPGVQAYFAYGDTWAYTTGGWTNLSTGSTGTITLDLSGATGASSELKRFGIQIANVTGATYEVTSAKLINSGSSGGTSGGGSTDFGTERDYSSGLAVTIANQGTPSNDWSGFDISMTNNSGSSICDWIIVLEVPSGTASAFKCWNATFVADGDTIYLYPMQSGANAVIASGALTADVPGGGFSSTYVDASSITIKAVYYNKGTSSEYDYSEGDTNDETGGSGGGNSGNSVSDTSTNKDLNVEFNYAKALQESLYFYDANMCGSLEGTCALDWRGNCHTYDANVTYTNNGVTYNVDASGGFHDAGDHVKFGLPQGYAASMLGISYYQFKDAFTDLGQASHLQTITDYFCDYFRRCTVYDASGNVIAFCYQVGEGNSDHGVWCAPEGQQINRPAYFADSSNPATDQVSVAIAALAMNYKNFGNAQDLKVAKDLYTFMQNNSKACATEGAGSFYASSSYGDDMALAASALAIATGDSSYNSVYNTYKDNNDNGVNQYWVLDWANTGALAAMLQKDTAKLSSIANVCKNKATIDGVFNCVSDWGSCRYSAAEQFVGLAYDQITGNSTFTDWATSQMNYMLGDNPNKRCYIVGYNENSSKYPHHRAASRSTDASITMENHYTLLGALVGGPGSNGTYKDDQADYYCNEVALDYNAGLVGAAAGLYLVHKDADTVYLSYAKKNTDNYSTSLATAEELAEVGVTTYYGSTTPAEPVAVESVSLDVTTLSLVKGDTESLTATVSPAKATNKKVTWSSSDKSVATVDDSGKVTAVASGTSTITVTTEDGAKTATCVVTVTNPVTGLTLNKTATSLARGDSETLTYTVTPTDADAYTVSWKSSNADVASVDNTGKITAVGKGTATITVTLTRTADQTTIEKTCAVTVTVPLEGITLNVSSLDLDEGEMAQLSVTPTPSDAELGTVTWSSSDKSVATVDDNGEVTAVAAGTTTITARAGNQSATCTVVVNKVPVANVTASVTELQCSDLEYGYTITSTAEVVLRNEGDADTTSLRVALEDGSAFTILDGVTTNMVVNGSDSVVIAPVEGLSADTYTDNLVITYNANKKITIPVSVTVAKKKVTVTANDQSRVYGEANPDFAGEYIAEGLVGTDMLNVTLTTIATASSSAGSYEIVVTVADDANYDITAVNGTLTVMPKAITDITFPTATDIEVGQTLEDSELSGGDMTFGTYAWKDDSQELSRGTHRVDVVLTLSALALRNYSFTGVEGYDATAGTITKSIAVNVLRAGLPTITFPTVTELQYGQSLSDAMLIGGSTEYGTFAWEDATVVMTEADVNNGMHTANMVFEWSDGQKAEYGILDTDEDATITRQVSVVVTKADNDEKPATAVLKERTANSIKLQPADGVQFRLNDGEWQDSAEFGGLGSFTSCKIYTRYKETATHKASAVCETPLQVYTLVAEPYTIDVSKFVGDEAQTYVDALRENDNAEPTVSYVDGELTLDMSDVEYTITGSNPDLIIHAPYGTATDIVLENAKIKELDVTKGQSVTGAQTTIQVNGTNTVSCIASQDDNEVAITGTGTLKAENIIVDGTLTINGPTVEVTSTAGPAISAGELVITNSKVVATGGAGSPALSADTIRIENAEVVATGGAGASAIETTSDEGNIVIKNAKVEANAGAGYDGAPIVSDNITLVGNNSISSSTGTDNLYSSTPKDENGNVLASYTVKFLDADGKTELKSVTFYAGSQITLPTINAEEGCVLTWENQETKEKYQPQAAYTVNGDVTFVVNKEKILVNKIILDITSVTLEVGESEILTETVEPANAFDKSVTWSSSDSTVATVTADGEVDAVSPGTAVIAVKAKDGSGVTSTCTVTVVQGEPETVYAESIKITGETKKVAPGKKLKLKAAVYPDNAVNKQVKWKVSNNKYAKVNSNGVVTTKTAGKGKKVTVTAYLADDSSIKATYKISIMKNPVKKIKLSAKTTTLKKGKSVKIKAKFTPANGISKELTWTSSNKKVATVDSKGKVTAKKKGTTKITAKAKDGSGKKATIRIRVK